MSRLSNMPDVFVAVISGRSVTNVKEMVGIEGITYAGNHGLEIIHPDGTRFTHPMPAEMEGKVGVLLEQLQQECCKVKKNSYGFCFNETLSGWSLGREQRCPSHISLQKCTDGEKRTFGCSCKRTNLCCWFQYRKCSLCSGGKNFVRTLLHFNESSIIRMNIRSNV